MFITNILINYFKSMNFDKKLHTQTIKRYFIGNSISEGNIRDIFRRQRLRIVETPVRPHYGLHYV